MPLTVTVLLVGQNLKGADSALAIRDELQGVSHAGY